MSSVLDAMKDKTQHLLFRWYQNEKKKRPVVPGGGTPAAGSSLELHRCDRGVCHPRTVEHIYRDRPAGWFDSNGLSRLITICDRGAFHDCRLCAGRLVRGTRVCPITGLEKVSVVTDNTPGINPFGSSSGSAGGGFYGQTQVELRSDGDIQAARSHAIDLAMTFVAHGLAPPPAEEEGENGESVGVEEGTGGVDIDVLATPRALAASGREPRRRRKREWTVLRDRKKASTKALLRSLQSRFAVQSDVVTPEQAQTLTSACRANDARLLALFDVTLNMHKNAQRVDPLTALLYLRGDLPICINNYKWVRGRAAARHGAKQPLRGGAAWFTGRASTVIRRRRGRGGTAARGRRRSGAASRRRGSTAAEAYKYPIYYNSLRMRIYTNCEVTVEQLAIQFRTYSFAGVMRTRMNRHNCDSQEVLKVYEFLSVAEEYLVMLLPGPYRLSNYAKLRQYTPFLHVKTKQYIHMGMYLSLFSNTNPFNLPPLLPALQHGIPVSFDKCCDGLDIDLQKNNETTVEDMLHTTYDEYAKSTHEVWHAPHLILDQWPTKKQWVMLLKALMCGRGIMTICGGNAQSKRKTRDITETILGLLYLFASEGYALWRPWNCSETILPAITLLRQPGYVLHLNLLTHAKDAKDASRSHKDGSRLIRSSMAYVHQKGIPPHAVLDHMKFCVNSGGDLE